MHRDILFFLLMQFLKSFQDDPQVKWESTVTLDLECHFCPEKYFILISLYLTLEDVVSQPLCPSC